MSRQVYEKIANTEGALKAVVEGKKIKLAQPTIDGNDEAKRSYALIEAIESASSFGGAIEVYASRKYKDFEGVDKTYEIKGKLFEKEPVEGKNKRQLVFKSENGFEFSSNVARLTKEQNEPNAGQLSVKDVSAFLNKVISYNDEGVEKKLSNPLRGMEKVKLTPVKYFDSTNPVEKDAIMKAIEVSKSLTEGQKLIALEFTKTDAGVVITAGAAAKPEVEQTEPEIETPEVGEIER